MAGVIIERVNTIEQANVCRELVKQVWGPDDTCSAAQMWLHSVYGGILLLAYMDQQPIGFLYSFPALYRGEWVLWSHETAVLPDYLHFGIGYQMKIEQKRMASELGYHTIAWTFDPLVSRNAHFNLNKLGASIVEYKVNVYGITENDPLNQDLPTDRLVAIWSVQEMAQAPLFKLDMAFDIPVLITLSKNGEPEIQESFYREFPDSVATRIPYRIDKMLLEQPEVSLRWRLAFRGISQLLFEKGYEIKQFIPTASYSTYIWSRNGGSW